MNPLIELVLNPFAGGVNLISLMFYASICLLAALWKVERSFEV